MKSKICVAMMAVVVLAVASALQAAEPAWTSITVEKMHCGGCAKKIAAQLYVVRGVKEVRVNLNKKALIVVPLASQTLSPRAMWEAVEKAEDRPLVLAGPSGIFKQKPSF